MRMRIAAMIAGLAIAGAAAAAPVCVVELYQSQGCSSCPPAIANVNRLADRADLIVLDFAVTYWDRLGWKDSFAAPEFTRRQWDYAHAGGRPQVSTPQVIVNGRGVGVGGNGPALAALVAGQAPLAGPVIRDAAGQVTIGGGPSRRRGVADIWLVRYDPRALSVAIARGENAGRTLVHRNMVRSIVLLGGWTGTMTRFAIPPAPPGLRSAVLVQERGGGPILAAATIGLTAPGRS